MHFFESQLYFFIQTLFFFDWIEGFLIENIYFDWIIKTQIYLHNKTLWSHVRIIKGTVHPKIRNTYFSSYLYLYLIHLNCFGVSCRVLQILVVELSFLYKGTRWHSTWDVQNKTFEKLNSNFQLLRSHDPWKSWHNRKNQWIYYLVIIPILITLVSPVALDLCDSCSHWYQFQPFKQYWRNFINWYRYKNNPIDHCILHQKENYLVALIWSFFSLGWYIRQSPKVKHWIELFCHYSK